ncbi:DUF1116 domain-containing protein [Marinobacter nanhaiticus D15-8W]|uniref:DUF1116 domain-containing protein n=1 Tax=Marinobacter nanhaiticus D15-8W TaxID=626887 RepID=N6X1X9_9GAMM|nr:DUF1116 domain-containing protein [Marinobacter nanhaiticus]ENO15078.1 DUF1116 domain-containing protein [Marinobacter nanhaiticus D15-8W]BES69224.1 DUF1116 domain-containing protein [Marinobacter nanhaiticus D15-8W]
MTQIPDNRYRRFENLRLEGVARLGDVVPDVHTRLLLHAGPPYMAGPLPAPVRNAAINAILFERLADSAEDPAAMLDRGDFKLSPAQDVGVTTPLAQVVSASMPVFVIGDGDRHIYAPLVEGAPPALRFGSPDSQCVDNLRLHARFAALELAASLDKHPVPLARVIEYALANGNDCHTLTDQANQALLSHVSDLSSSYRTLLEQSPGFVLPVLMGACGWLLRYGNSPISAGGGNGREFGLRLKGESHWLTTVAEPPTGPRFPAQAGKTALGAIGDSAVIDLCGLGGQALDCARPLANEWRDLLPDDWEHRPDAVLDANTGVVSPAEVVRHQTPPIINLALVGADQDGGILGKGFYLPPLALFQQLAARMAQ